MSTLAFRPRWRPRRAKGHKYIRYTLLGLFMLPWVVFPFWLLLVNSFKTQGQASVISLSLPKVWHVIENYRTVIDQGAYFTGLKNSLIITVPTILVVLLLGSMAAWAYARSSSRTLRLCYLSSTLSIVLPPAIIPTVYILMQLGINGSRFGYFLTLSGTRVGMVIFLATGFVRTLPYSLEEAAQIDGASRWRIYWSVVLPLLRPVLFTAAIMQVMSVWNDFFYALFLLHSQSEATLPLLLYQFASTSSTGVAWNLVFADVVLTGLPLFIIYIVLQRRVMSGLTEGSVTG